MFDQKTYINRRHRLKQQLGSGIVLFPGHDESPINFADNTYPFRQDSSFLYFFGHNLPGLTGVLDIDKNDDYLFGNDAGIDEMVWTGYQHPVSELAQMVGIKKTGSLAELESFMKTAFSSRKDFSPARNSPSCNKFSPARELSSCNNFSPARELSSGNTIHFLPPYRAQTHLKLLRWSAFSSIAILPSTELVKAVIAQRQIKTDQEIIQIEQAINITVDMHIDAMQMAKPGIKERHVIAALYSKAHDAGVSMSFTPIATTQGETLHNHFYGNTLEPGDLFLLDSGVENAMHYAADLSSTFPVNGTFTSMQKDIYSITLDAHEAAIAAIKPGVAFKDVHFKACGAIVSGLKNLGLMKADLDDAVLSGAHALFFPCGTGHMMGLDVHDMEDLGETYVGYDGEAKSTQFGLKSLRLGKVLKPGFVLTIEPGIYFIPALIEKWRTEKKFADFINYAALDSYLAFGGIRNEEDYLITETGARLLGKPKPKTIADIENLKK
ncbi:MAG: aminopeptidase P family protein [Desulfamplus sp.]|nr:aminopeptidase P family protein [Desulfamplus sp.]